LWLTQLEKLTSSQGHGAPSGSPSNDVVAFRSTRSTTLGTYCRTEPSLHMSECLSACVRACVSAWCACVVEGHLPGLEQLRPVGKDGELSKEVEQTVAPVEGDDVELAQVFGFDQAPYVAHKRVDVAPRPVRVPLWRGVVLCGVCGLCVVVVSLVVSLVCRVVSVVSCGVGHIAEKGCGGEHVCVPM